MRLHRIAPETVWSRRPEHIREWERMLVDEGTALVKVFLNVSKDEQRERHARRPDRRPSKRWKFRRTISRSDVASTSTSRRGKTSSVRPRRSGRPGVVPADRNWVKSTAVAALLVDALERLDPKFPDAEAGIEGLTVT